MPTIDEQLDALASRKRRLEYDVGLLGVTRDAAIEAADLARREAVAEARDTFTTEAGTDPAEIRAITEKMRGLQPL